MAKVLTSEKESLDFEFTERQKEKIYKRYDNRCALCSLGSEEGVEVHVVHILPRKEDGKAVAKNGLLLCSEHNETRYDANANHAKIYTSLMLKVAKSKKDKRMESLYSQVLKLFEKYNISKTY